MDEIQKRFSEIKIEMDSNPILHAEFRKRIRERGLKGVKIRERNSRHSRLIQIADYVVNISAKKVKNTPKAREWYNIIAKKVIAFIEVADWFAKQKVPEGGIFGAATCIRFASLCRRGKPTTYQSLHYLNYSMKGINWQEEN